MSNNFLAKIWGEAGGQRCVVEGKGMAHSFLNHNDIRYPKNKDVWYAPALFRTLSRTIPEVAMVKSFWLDIDAKGEYTLETAAFELKRFVDELQLPSPSVVCSGNGLHVYWILTDYLTPNDWHIIARALRLACIDLNLKADHAVTIDIARILRVPGTKNYKDPKNPKPVEVLRENEPCSVEDLKESLDSYIFKAELENAAKETNKSFAIEFPQTPKDANSIANNCAQVSAFRDTNGQIPEPEWYAGLGVLALCTDGLDIAQRWSSGHPKYSKRGTEKKFERAKEFAPTTCKKFEEVNPDLCRACPYFGKISSPVQLGETVTPLEILKEKDSSFSYKEDDPKALQTTESKVPKPYLCGKEGVWKYQPATDTEGPEKQFIASHPIWVSRVMVGEDGGGSEIELTWVDAHSRQRSANIRQALIEKPAEFGSALRDKNVGFYGNLREFNYYIQRCIDHINRRQKEETVYSKFGFTDDDSGFLIGRDLITAKGLHNANISSRINAKRVRQMDARGTLDNWKRACSLFDKPAFWPHRFAIIACLGTPLFRISGNEGSVLSLAGETSGGKTTAANVGIAAFADPRAFTIDPTSTIKAFYEHWRQAGNLPLVINEAATSIRKDWLSNIILAAANGKARDTLTQSREMYDSGTWDTLTIFTNNTQLLDMPESVIGEASRRRVLEIPFLPENCLPLSIGRPVNALIEKNYGHAGRELIKAVLSDPSYVSNKINEHTEKLQDGVHSVHRYNLWLIACASVAADLGTGLGLIDFETADCIENAIQILKTSVREAPTPSAQVESLIARYTQVYQENIGVKEGSNNGWHREPRGYVMGKVTTEIGKPSWIALPVRELKNFALDNGVDVNRLKSYMKERRQVRLSRVGNPVECWILPHDGDV